MTSTTDRRLPFFFFFVASFAIGEGVQVSNGNLHPNSIGWLTVGLIAALLGVVLPTRRFLEEHVEKVTLALLSGALAWQFWTLANAMPGIYMQVQNFNQLLPFYGALMVSAVLVGLSLTETPLFGRALPFLLVGAFLWLGAWMIRTSPNPIIDVFVFQRDGAAELLAGRNPYAMQYPDIYGNSPFYGEGLSINGKLQFGFPYFPLSLLLALPGHVGLGDYRYSQIGASALAAVLMMHTRKGPLPRGLAALYLFTPRAFFVVEQGWTDPFVVFMLAAVVFSAVRFPRFTPYVFGLFLATKQYLVFAVPAAFLLLPRPLTRRSVLEFTGKAVAAGAIVTLPFFLWDPKAFWFDVASLQTLQPFRVESMSYLAWWAGQPGHERPSTAWAFVMATAGVALGLWRLPRTPAGFAACCTLAFLAFFAFNKQAFCNYYMFIIGAAAIAASAIDRSEQKPA